MEFENTYYWLIQSERRKKILIGFDQPLTATHIARRTDITLDSCLHLLWGLTLYGVIYCLNKTTRYNKLHWLTELGRKCQRKLRQAMRLRPLSHRFPNISWDLFSSICYRHRTAVITAMNGSLQAAAIKRKALFQNPQLRMSANNVRDVTKYLLKVGIVHKVSFKRKTHPGYELTHLGEIFKELLLGARGF